MEAAARIRHAVATVSALRADMLDNAAMQAAVTEVKRLQARRFAGTYADLLAQPRYAAASRFFLDELYSERDYSERDAQFARIASAIERLLPGQAVQTAVSLAQLHALTETLDHAMAQAWLASAGVTSHALRYAGAWKAVGRRQERAEQLAAVLALGRELARLTRAPGLRTLLRMMRGPAQAGGLGALQRFLETGFDTFAGMSRSPGTVEAFLRTIEEREQAMMALLFDAEDVTCETELAATLGQAR